MEVRRRTEAVVRPPADDAGEPRLLELLRGEIERDGPITFARFMQLALYEPELGYYSSSAARPTRGGDFLTAPEMHPIFGHSLAGQVHEMWQRLDEPSTFTLREYGAGSGALAVAVAQGLAQLGSGLLKRLRYQPRDLAGQLAEVETRLGQAGLADMLDLDRSDGPVVGCILANEFLDALPVHRVVVKAGRLREIYVDWRAGGPTETTGDLSRSEIADWFAAARSDLVEEQRAEVNLAMLDWLADAAAGLQRGYILIVDYGAHPAELYGPRRRGGTLRAFRGQHVSGDALRGVGRQDLTAHVDLGAVERGAVRAGLQLLGQTTQAEFLVGCGLEEILADERLQAADDWQATTLLRSAVGRLLDPRALGGYAVVVLGRGVTTESPLRGLAHRLPRRG